MRALPLLASAGLLIIGGCNAREPVAINAKAVNLPLPSNDIAPDPAGAPPRNGSPLTAAAAVPPPRPAANIPADLQGRWGLTPADCNSARANAKGLLVVSAGALRFYESRALPSSDVETDPTSVGGDFDFSGEGEDWTKFEALKRNGDKLTRTETKPAASYTYAKC